MNYEFKKYRKYALILIIFAFLLRLAITYFVHPSGDAAWHLNIARFIAETNQIPLHEPLGRNTFAEAPPLFHILMAIAYKLFNWFGDFIAVKAMQTITPIFSMFTLVFTYLIIEHIAKPKYAFYSILFLAFLPAHFYLSTLGYVDITLMAICLMSIYFALKQKYFTAGVFTALAMLTKYNGVFIIPIVAYIIFSKEKLTLLPYLKWAVVLPLGTIWYIRNWILLGNPVWYHLSSIFGQTQTEILSATGDSFQSSIHYFITLKPYLVFLSGAIGIPSEYWKNIFFFNIPHINILLVIWLAGLILFFLPVILGLSKLKKQKKLFFFWMLPYLLLGAIYIYSYQHLVFRYWLPLLPIFAYIWARGFAIILQKKPIAIIIIFIIIATGITTVEIGKANLSSSHWKSSFQDFDWVKQNTSPDAIILNEGRTTLSFNTHRFAVNYEKEKTYSTDYVLIYPNSEYKTEFINRIRTKYAPVYKNPKTGFELFKVVN